MLLLAAALSVLLQAQAQSAAQLRAALDALRTGKPGEAGFERALPQLPALLASDSSYFVAGAAWLAGHHARTECVPALTAALARENQTVRPYVETKRALMDALIRLDARVAPELLAAHPQPELLAEIYLLAERDRDHTQSALLGVWDTADRANDAARWAAACALVEQRHPRISERLIAGTPWAIDVVVRDAGAPEIPAWRGGGGGWGSAHELWPPRAFYTLHLPGPDEPLLPIRHTRREATRSISRPMAPDDDVLLALRVRLLDQLLGECDERGLLRSSERIQLEFKGTAACEQALRERLTDLQGRIARVARRLAEAGLVSDLETCLARVTLSARIYDSREVREPALPEPVLPGVEYTR